MIILVDGYNVLKQVVHAQEITDKQRAQFIKQLAKYSKKKGHAVVVVFDGGPDAWPVTEKIQGIAVVYSGVRESADDYIKRYMQQHKTQDIVLVSSDHELCLYASQLSIASIDSFAFYKILRQTIQSKATQQEVRTTKIVKTTETVSPELDALMEEAAKHALLKKEDRIDEEQADRDKKGSKRERKLKQTINKL
ncbi:MAG TPA: hypothetical protein ENI08_01925 [Candidatus Dependentiae bacterium]|nr:hypothetical protein [Candidatus Dependentiae bacterium]